MNRTFIGIAFALGLAAVGWVGYGYLATNPLAAAMTALIAAFYIAGGVELHRYRQATASLDGALATLPDPLPSLGDWLAALHPSLRQPVRLRIEGERVGLPGPSMTPYLVGLLVLLGMLGTFLGMVVTLNGAVAALQSTTDLPAMRAALAAPVKGLGLAFGTSVAGVAASAMLGLISALVRRERLLTGQRLDARIATTLRVHSAAHQREQTLAVLQLQARAMPEVVAQMRALIERIERHGETLGERIERQGQTLGERLLAGQDRHHRHTETTFTELASSVDRSLKQSLAESARAAGAIIAPVVEQTMSGIARETAVFHERLADTVATQLDGLATRFDGTVTTVAGTWTAALDRHERTNESLTDGLRQTLAGFTATFDRGAASLLASVDGRQAAAQVDLQAAIAETAHRTASLHERLAETVQVRLDTVTDRQAATVATLLADAASADRQRLAEWTASLAAMSASLRDDWQQAAASSLSRQQVICATLESTSREIQSQAGSHARATIAEMSRLIDTASEAPRAAAELVGSLRDKLSDSIARDNTMLDERSRIMATLNTLLDAVGAAATQQREAIDALVASSGALLQQASQRFDQTLAAESGRIAEAASQVAGSAVEVASLGESFGVAVQLFSETGTALATQLQRIEGALAKSTARSDEQLAYYVAQAREIVDLSISSQKQIVEDLQRLAIRQAA